MKKIGFITNLDKDPDLVRTKEILDYVISRGCKPILTNLMAERFSNIPAGVGNADEIYEIADFIVVLGGDGTILRVARKAAPFKLPILGINLGTLGYLADVEGQDAITAVERVLDENYVIEKRMMLEAFVNNDSLNNDVSIALNEVTINNGVFSRMLEINFAINDQYVDTYKADGVIVSTPTGSTAYNLSAGGPILKPDTELMAITFICPHALFSRPYVISGNDVVKIKIGGGYDNIIMSVDGQQSIPLKNGDSITIRRSKYQTNIIKTTDLSFYDILRRKMVEVRK